MLWFHDRVCGKTCQSFPDYWESPAAGRLPFATQLGPGSNWDVAWDDRFVRPRRRGVGLTTVVVLCCAASPTIHDLWAENSDWKVALRHGMAL